MAAPLSPTEHIRNVCILAHVDHGKTTCADILISESGVISRHSAGRIRYMDSRQDEQERQITMKSSSIALQWSPKNQPPHTVNLIDSPGHVDFTSEVSTAARLADGALVVVDVVEGVEAQTRTVLRQAWRDRVKTCLLLNKVDRLIFELELSPLEAYRKIERIVEQINAVNQQFLAEEAMGGGTKKELAAKAASSGHGDVEEGIDLTSTTALEYMDEATEAAWVYSPEKGNVTFGSAFHGWGFRVDTFAELAALKMGAKKEALRKVLWGNWKYNPKTKRVTRISADDTRSKPMFVQFVLEPLWKVYGASYKALDLEVLSRMHVPSWKDMDLGRLTAGQGAVRDLMSRWLPFAPCVFQMIVDHLPSPAVAAASRLPVMCPRWFAADGKVLIDRLSGDSADIAKGLLRSDREASAVVYVAKFLAADLERQVLTGDAVVGDEDIQFVGICRVFSGTLQPGQDLVMVSSEMADAALLGTVESAAITGRKIRRLEVERLYLLKGRFLEEVGEAPAGYIVAARFGLHLDAPQERGTNNVSEFGVERCLTLCSSEHGPSFETPYSSQAYAILRVNIEPQKISDSDALLRGLRLLHRADPSVTVDALPTGENVLGCCGDEHLKRCVTDLQNLFAKGVPLRISPPLVAIRESFALGVSSERLEGAAKGSAMWLPTWASHLVDASTEASSHSNEHAHEESSTDACSFHFERVSMSADGSTSVWTANRKTCLRLKAIALPLGVLEWMDSNVEDLETLVHRHRVSPSFGGGAAEGTHTISLSSCLRDASKQLEAKLRDAEFDFGGASSSGAPALCGVSVARGSRTLLFDATASNWTLWDQEEAVGGLVEGSALADSGVADGCIPKWMRPSILSGFRSASNSGPLCEEPMRGIAFVVQACQFARSTIAPAGYPAVAESQVHADGVPPTAAALSTAVEPYGPMSGQVMVAIREACRCCLFRRGFARISEAMLSLEVQSEQEMLGKVYAVLGKRRVRVLEEGLRDGTSLFYISSYLPLADSFGLAQDLRVAASGQVSFHCAFSHWELTEDDPFQEASLTAEELEEVGIDQRLPPNTARKLIDAIRKRKGLVTDEKVVLFATKQRTVTRNK